MFRPINVYRNQYVVVKADGKVLSSRKHMILTPGEMAVVPMAVDFLEKCRGAKAITVEISADNPPKE